jgi:hypothetical protein
MKELAEAATNFRTSVVLLAATTGTGRWQVERVAALREVRRGCSSGKRRLRRRHSRDNECRIVDQVDPSRDGDGFFRVGTTGLRIQGLRLVVGF